MKNLNESKTYLHYADECGMCNRCYEYGSLLSECCGSGFEFEGGSISPEDIIEEIAEELSISYDDAQELVDAEL